MFGKQTAVIGSLLLTTLVSTGCASTGAASKTGPAVLVNAHTEGENVQNVPSTHVGEACTHNVLGLVAIGDASIPAAKRDAGIDRVASVNHRYFSVLTLYGRYCLRVTGSSSRATERHQRDERRRRTHQDAEREAESGNSQTSQTSNSTKQAEKETKEENEKKTEGPAAIDGSIRKFRQWSGWIKTQSGKTIVIETTDSKTIKGELFGVKGSSVTVKTKGGKYQEISGGEIEVLRAAK